MNGSRLKSVIENKPRLATQIGFILYGIASLIFLEMGQVNGDEGWYLYGSKLAMQGQLPYRDFAYTQMPLLPYIYGVIQIVYPSLWWGRLTSIVISLGIFVLGVVAARRVAGTRAGAITALFLAAFTFGIYFNTIVKTYALLSFFFVATLWVLTSQLDDALKYPLASLFAFAATFVRITALFFLAPLLLYAFVAARSLRTRVLLLIECGVAILAGGFFLLPDEIAARWNLFDSHLSHWGDATTYMRVESLLTERLPDLIQNFGLLVMLFAAAVYAIGRIGKLDGRRQDSRPLVVVTVGLFLFAMAHLVNGIWVIEYMVPAVVAFFPILGIVLSQAYGGFEKSARLFFQGLVAMALVLLVFNESVAHIDVTGRQLPLSEVEQAAMFVQRESQPSDLILALEGLGVVVDADRSTLPGFTLAQFSLQSLDTSSAQQLHVVNPALLVAAVNQSNPPIILLTDADWVRLNLIDVPNANLLRQMLAQRYHLGLSIPRFGQSATLLSIYVSNSQQ